MLNTNLQSELLQSYISRVKNGSSEAPVQNQTSKSIQPEEFKTTSKDKKKKIAKIALLSASALVLLGGSIAALRYRNQIAKASKDLYGKTKEIITEAGTKAKETGEALSEYENGANNITNIKDSVCRKFLMKIPGYAKFDKFTSDLYRKSITKTLVRTGEKAKNATSSVNEKLVNSISDPIKRERLRELLLKRQENINAFTDAGAIRERVSKLDKSMLRLDKDCFKRLIDAKDDALGEIKALTKESVASKRLAESRTLQSKILSPFKGFGLTEKEGGELKELIACVEDKGAIKQFEKAQKRLNRSFLLEREDLFGKLRDINFGCAPTDILGILGTAGLLGIYTAQADTKEEKVKVSLTTGIPLLTTLGTTIFATTKMINGFRALGLGLVTGAASKFACGIINKKYQEKHRSENQPETIVTLDDYVNKIKETGMGYIGKQNTTP